MDATADEVRAKARERYSVAANGRGCCGNDACCAIGYSPAELEGIPAESVLGLGSGNPVRHAELRPGETVVDLGSGAGIDVFLASRLVGPAGHATGIDMTPTMVTRATTASESHDVRNASFVLAPIEKLPLPDGHADVVLSNCVINLSPDKPAVFAEAFRILKPGGRLVISDVVQERDLGRIEKLPLPDGHTDVVLSNCVINLSPDKPAVFAEAFRILKPGGRLVISDVVQERDLGRIEDDCGCVGNAMVRGEYLETIRNAGFVDFRMVEDRPWRTGPSGIEASAVTLIARKPGTEVKM